MNSQLLTLFPGLLHDGGMAHTTDLLDDIEFTQAIETLCFILDIVDLLAVTQIKLADGMYPVYDQPELLAFQRGFDTAAAVVTADNDMFDLEYIDCILYDGQTVEVGMQNDVCDIAMNEQLARQQIDDFIGRNPAVGAAYPQIFGCFAVRTADERSPGFPLSSVRPRHGY